MGARLMTRHPCDQDSAVWKLASRRADALMERAEQRYPKREGYQHDLESNGWPDTQCSVAVYRPKADRRTKLGFRLVLVARFSTDAGEQQ